MENQQEKIFANSSQTHFALRNPIPHYTVALRNLPHKTYAKFRIAKIRNEFANQIRNAKISQCQFRNAKFNFAMPIPISQCQSQFRNAKFNFAMPISISQCQYTVHLPQPIAKFRIAKFTAHFANFANPFSHCQIHCLLRNSHLQALSSSVINATDF